MPADRGGVGIVRGTLLDRDYFIRRRLAIARPEIGAREREADVHICRRPGAGALQCRDRFGIAAVERIGAAEQAKDAAAKAVDASKEAAANAGTMVKEGAEATGAAMKAAGHEVKEGAKEVGHEIAETAKDAKDAAVDAAKKKE